MPRRRAIIQDHPDPAGNRFCHALADAYAEGAVLGGHEVACIEPAKLDSPLLRTRKEFETEAIPEMLAPARDVIVAAQHLLIVYPCGMARCPRSSKKFIEQVMRPGLALEYRKGASHVPS